MVVIVSIICAVGFVGVLPIVLGLVVFGGSGSSDAVTQLIDDAKRRVDANPNDIGALVDLAAQYRAANKPEDSAATLQKAIALGPKTSEELQNLIGGLGDQPGLQLQVLQDYTKKNPKDANALFLYASTSETVGQVVAARLAYQRAFENAPKGSQLKTDAKTALDRLKETPSAPTPTQPPPTPTAPATPATPGATTPASPPATPVTP